MALGARRMPARLRAGIGGCVSCTACAIVSEAVDGRYGGYHNSYGYRSDDGYRYGYGDSGGNDGADVDFSIEYIKDSSTCRTAGRSTASTRRASTRWAPARTSSPVRYYVEGDPADEADYVRVRPHLGRALRGGIRRYVLRQLLRGARGGRPRCSPGTRPTACACTPPPTPPSSRPRPTAAGSTAWARTSRPAPTRSPSSPRRRPRPTTSAGRS